MTQKSSLGNHIEVVRESFDLRRIKQCNKHCMKYVRIRIFIDPYSPVYGRIRVSENPCSRIFYTVKIWRENPTENGKFLSVILLGYLL